ncbi:MAG: RHS repeat-associated core domain-containing protein, partial [Armatimonadia bacterium]
TLNQLTLERSTAGALTYYQWQADGAMASKHDVEGWTYFTWDVDEVLTQAEYLGPLGGYVSVAHQYDADMKRVSMGLSQGGGLPVRSWSNRYLYDGEKVAARRYVADASPESWVLYHNEGPSIYSPLAGSSYETPGWTSRWYLFDALGSTVGMTDNTGGLIGSRLYEAFGSTLHSSGIGGDPYNYVGAYGYYQDTFALHLLWHRWYDAGTGRFVSRDPVGAEGAPYVYVHSDPVRMFDPRGMERDDPDAPDWDVTCLERYAACMRDVQRVYLQCRCETTVTTTVQDLVAGLCAGVAGAWGTSGGGIWLGGRFISGWWLMALCGGYLAGSSLGYALNTKACEDEREALSDSCLDAYKWCLSRGTRPRHRQPVPHAALGV